MEAFVLILPQKGFFYPKKKETLFSVSFFQKYVTFCNYQSYESEIYI